MIDLSKNINYLKPEVDFKLEAFDVLDNNSEKLYSSLSQYYQINNDECEIFNGSACAISSFFKYINLCESFENVVLYAPIYPEYKKIISSFDFNIILVNRFDDLYKNIPLDSLVIFTNPSSPDGKYYDIDTLMEFWISKNATIFVDETFIEYSDKKSAKSYINIYDKVYVLESMSRFYSFEGIQIATLLSNKNSIERIKLYEPKSKLSNFDSLYIMKMLEDKNFKVISKAINSKNMAILETLMKNSDVFEKVFPSNTNFILARLSKMSAVTFQNLLKEYDILVNDCSYFEFLDARYVRITASNEKQLNTLSSALKAKTFVG